MMDETLAYAAILAHKGAGVSEERLVNILKSGDIVYPLHDIQKLVTALEYIDIHEVIHNPLVIQPLPVIKQNPPKEEEKKVEVAVEEGDYGLKALFG